MKFNNARDQDKPMQLDRRNIDRRCLVPGHWTRSAFGSIVPSAITSYSLAAGERGCAEKDVGRGGDQLILNVKNDLRRANVRYFPGDAGQAVLRFVDNFPLELPKALSQGTRGNKHCQKAHIVACRTLVRLLLLTRGKVKQTRRRGFVA